MTDLQDKHCVCFEDPSSCHLTDLNRMNLQFHACIAWESWSDREYVLVLSIFNIKCNEVPNLTMINQIGTCVSCFNQFESTLNILQYITRYHEFSSRRSNLPCCINALVWLEYWPCLKILVILVQHVETGCMNKLSSFKFVAQPSSITIL